MVATAFPDTCGIQCASTERSKQNSSASENDEAVLLETPTPFSAMSLSKPYIGSGVDPVGAVLAEARMLLSRGQPYAAEQAVFEAGRAEVIGGRGLSFVRKELQCEWERGVHFELPLGVGSIERQELPGRGVGYVARQHIPAASTVIFDTAFWTTKLHCRLEALSQGSSCAACAEEDELRENWHLRDGIDDPQRLIRLKDVLEMAGAREEREACPTSGVVSLLRRAFACNLVEPTHGEAALFPEFSRLNHSCQPNCTWHADALRMYVRTVVDVAPGEELCVTYIMQGEGVDAQTRRQWLWGNWGFRCTCPRCEEE